MAAHCSSIPVSATTPEAMDARANRLAGVALTAGALLTQFDAPPAGPVWGAIDAAARAGLRSRVDATVRTARSDTDRWRASAVTERTRLAAAARVASPSSDSSDSSSDSAGSSSGSGSSGYTGLRCYNPGGKTYRPC